MQEIAGEQSAVRRPAHRPGESHCIRYNEDYSLCYVYTDVEINGLEPIATNVKVGE